MATILHIPSTPNMVYTTKLGDANYEITLVWSPRNWAWFVSVRTGGGVFLARSAKLVLNVPLLRQNQIQGPAGTLMLVRNVLTEDGAAARWNVGGPDKDFSLLYLTPEEVTAL
jgi:hypothetical protein